MPSCDYNHLNVRRFWHVFNEPKKRSKTPIIIIITFIYFLNLITLYLSKQNCRTSIICCVLERKYKNVQNEHQIILCNKHGDYILHKFFNELILTRVRIVLVQLILMTTIDTLWKVFNIFVYIFDRKYGKMSRCFGK